MGQPIFAPQMLRKDLNGILIEAEMAERPPFLYERIATILPTTSDKENLAWIGNPASMAEITDQMPINAITDTGSTPQTGSDDQGYEIKVKTYGGALLFKRDDLADEKVGGYEQRIQDQYAVANGFPDEALITKLVAGTTDTCYLQVGATGEAFFTATHAARGSQSSTWSNLLSGNGTSAANCVTDIGLAIAALYNMTNEAGRPMNRYFKKFFILFPPAMEAAIRTAVLAGVISSTSNVAFSPIFELIPEPLLTGTSAADYYVGIMDSPVKGLLWLDREGVMAEEIGPGSEMWTNSRQVEYAVTRRGAPAYGLPQRLIMVNN